MKKLLLIPATLLFLFQGSAPAGGPKCDRPDSARCGMGGTCAAMQDKDGKTNCKSICHRGCCSCPDGSDPAEGKCPRDEPREYPQEENAASLHMMGCQRIRPSSICSRIN